MLHSKNESSVEEEESTSEITDELPIFILRTKHSGTLVPDHFYFTVDNM